MRPLLPRPVGISSKIRSAPSRIAGLPYLLPKAGRRQVGHGAHGLGDDGGDVAFLLQDVAQVLGAGPLADLQIGLLAEVGVAIGAAVAGEGGHMLGSREQGADAPAAEELLAADAGGTEAGAVKGIPEGESLEAARGHAGHLQGHLDGIRPAGGEEHLS